MNPLKAVVIWLTSSVKTFGNSRELLVNIEKEMSEFSPVKKRIFYCKNATTLSANSLVPTAAP